MNRRSMLVGLGAAAAASPLLAQGMQGMPGMAMGPEETNYMQRTKELGSLSLLTSREAMHRGVQGPMVLQFVKFEIAEQETIGDILMGMQMPSMGANGTVVPPTDEQAMSALNPEGRAMIMRMRALQGPEFERAYIMGQMDVHHRLLTVQEGYLSQGHMRGALNVAKLAKGMITEHLQLLSDIQGHMA